LWQKFDEQMIAQHLDMLRDHGLNTIRVFLTFDAFHREAGVVSADGEAKFRKLLGLCRDRGIRVIPSGPDHWEGTPGWRQGADAFADEKILAADEKWWSAFTGRFKADPTILAWDLYNEPSIRWDTPAMRPKWNEWLRREYGSETKIASSWAMLPDRVGRFGAIEIPPAHAAMNDQRLFDFQRFRQAIADEWTRRLSSAIRGTDPNHLVTVGYIQWVSMTLLTPGVQHYAGFDIRSNARLLDFVTIHFYPLGITRPDLGPEGMHCNAVDLENLLFECSVGKPVMIGEFGWYGGGDIRANGKVIMSPQTVEDQAAWCRTLLDVSRGRVCGWLNWAFADTPTSTDLTRWSGVWTEDLQLKPWGKLFSQLAREVAAKPQEPRPFPADTKDRLPDRKAMLTDPQKGYRPPSPATTKAKD
jgi:beta-galactosidase GanA